MRIDDFDPVDPLERLHRNGAARPTGAQQMVRTEGEGDVLGRERAVIVEDDILAQEQAQGARSDAFPTLGQRRAKGHVPGVIERNQRVEHLRHDAACRGVDEQDRFERRRKAGHAHGKLPPGCGLRRVVLAVSGIGGKGACRERADQNLATPQVEVGHWSLRLMPEASALLSAKRR